MKIPRIFHRIWFGQKDMPQEFINYGKTWIDHHPGWAMRLWTDENIPKLQNQVYFDATSNVVSKSDIARLELVYQNGGVYIDTDFECLKNIEPLMKGLGAFFVWEHSAAIGNSIFGGVPGHRALKTLIDGLGRSIEENRGECITEQSGPDYFTRILPQRKDIFIFKNQYFFPYSWMEPHRKGEPFPEAYAVHHWAHSW